MDILTHALSGLAVASVVASISKCRPAQKGVILFAGIFGAVFPDSDVLSRWSGFDSTIGSWFGLTHSGHEIYFSTFWYSHHVFFHSLLGALLISSLLWAIAGLVYWKILRQSPAYWGGMNYLGAYSLSFFLGYLMHLFGDMPTPSGTWGGVAFWYPLSEFVGGWGYTWWWNNYDIFLILLACCTVNILILFLHRWWERQLRWMPLLLFVGSCWFIGQQLQKRNVDFNRQDLAKKEHISRQIQHDILGSEVYDWMVKLDESLPVFF